MDRYVYEAALKKEDSGRYYVCFPELDDAYTSGDDMNDAVKKAGEVLELTIAAYLDEGKRLPIPQFRGNEGDLIRIGISVVINNEMRERMKSVTPSEAAKMLGVSKGRISQMLNAGILQSVPFGNERLVTLASVNLRLNSQRLNGRPKKAVVM